MTKKLTVSVRSHIDVEDIKNLLDSASRSSRYWAVGVEALGYESTTDGLVKCKGLNCGAHQVKIKLLDDDLNGKDRGLYLNLAKIKKGLTIMAKKFPKHFADILTHNDDGNISKVLGKLLRH